MYAKRRKATQEVPGCYEVPAVSPVSLFLAPVIRGECLLCVLLVSGLVGNWLQRTLSDPL
jgi:ABC-type molybdate transport system permease subunit